MLKTCRGYNSALECYRATYPDMKWGRTEFSKRDSYLYGRLLDEGTLNEVIPNIIRVAGPGRPSELNVKSLQKMLDFYEECEGNFSEIARRVGLPFSQVNYHLKKRDLEARGRCGPKNYYRARRT